MRNWIPLLFFALFPLLLAAQPEHVEVLDNGDLLIEDFEQEEVGTLPARWFNQKASINTTDMDPELRGTYHYRVVEEGGNKFLRFDGVVGKHLNFPTKKVREINLNKTPVLSWKWRLHDLPEGANEDVKSRNDVVASIYVVFEMGHVLFKKVPKSIVYTWSSTLAEGTELSKFFGNKKVVVLGSGEGETGKWLQFQRNIAKDFRRLFGDEPPEKPLAILILSDGNNTREHVKADYDDIKLQRERRAASSR